MLFCERLVLTASHAGKRLALKDPRLLVSLDREAYDSPGQYPCPAVKSATVQQSI